MFILCYFDYAVILIMKLLWCQRRSPLHFSVYVAKPFGAAKRTVTFEKTVRNIALLRCNCPSECSGRWCVVSMLISYVILTIQT